MPLSVVWSTGVVIVPGDWTMGGRWDPLASHPRHPGTALLRRLVVRDSGLALQTSVMISVLGKGDLRWC